MLFYLDHTGILAHNAKLQRPLLDYLKQNFWIVGTERMVYSTDYPYTFGTRPGGFPFLDTSNGVARSFLDNAPFTHEEKVAIGSGNWERLSQAYHSQPLTAKSSARADPGGAFSRSGRQRELATTRPCRLSAGLPATARAPGSRGGKYSKRPPRSATTSMVPALL